MGCFPRKGEAVILTSINLDAFTRAYVECALWSSNDESTPAGGDPMDSNYSIQDIAPEALEKIKDPLDKIASIEGLPKHSESVKVRFR